MTHLVITGFGSFGNVAANPTQRLVAHVREHLPCASTCDPSQTDCTLLLHEVLPVAGADVDEWISTQLRPCLLANTTPTPPSEQQQPAQQAVLPPPSPAPPPSAPQQHSPLHQQPGQELQTNGDLERSPGDSPGRRQVLVLHLGVASTATAFRLEQCCYNDATYRIPDVRGWQPQDQCIDPGAPHGTCVQGDQLDLEEAAQQLQAAGYDVGVSTDPGRYVCNWVYYRSHQLVRELHLNQCVTVLFVHVPPFEVVPEDVQQAFVMEMLQVLSRQLCSAPS